MVNDNILNGLGSWLPLTLPSRWIWRWKPIPTLQYSLPVLRPDTRPSSTSWCSKYARSDPVSTAERGNWKRSKSRRGTFILSRELSVRVLGHFQHFAVVPALWGNSLFHRWALPSAAGAGADLLAKRYLYHIWSHCLMHACLRCAGRSLSSSIYIGRNIHTALRSIYCWRCSSNSASVNRNRNMLIEMHTLIRASMKIKFIRDDKNDKSFRNLV